MFKSRISCAALLPFLMSTACTVESTPDENVGDVQDATQCGSTDDTQHVEQYNGALGVTRAFVNARQRPVGHHMIGGTFEACSGTLIARDLFLSAGHCGYAVGDQVWFTDQLDAAGTPRTVTRHDVSEVVEAVNSPTHDYAVVRLSGNPAATFGYTRIADDEASAIAPFPGQLLTLIGHPGVTDPARDFKRIGTGPFLAGASSEGPNWFLHQVDSVPGSSGSGVIRLDGQIVGVHTDGGCNRVDPPTGGNSAMRMPVLFDSSRILQQVASMQGVHFANINGAGGSDAIVVNFNRVAARPSNGTAFPSQADWTSTAYFGDRGTFFADVTGGGSADAIAVNNGGVIVRRSNGSSFTANETWTSIGFFGDRGTFFADVTGDGRADAIAVNNNAIVVRRSNGSSFTANETWSSTAFSGTHGTYFADVTGDGRADVIAVNSNLVSVRRSNGSSFTASENWTSNRFFGAFGTHFADVTGDGRADMIGVNNGVTTVRRSNGSSFGANENWIEVSHFGELGTHFSDVTGDGRADSIAVTANGITVRPSSGSAFNATQTWISTGFFGAR